MASYAPNTGERCALGGPDPIEEAILRAIIRLQYTTTNLPLTPQRRPLEHGFPTLLPNSRNHRTHPINVNATPLHVASPLSSVYAASFLPNQPMENPAFYPLNSTGSAIRVSDPHILPSSNYLFPDNHSLQSNPNPIVQVWPARPAFVNSHDSVVEINPEPNLTLLKGTSTNSDPSSDPFNHLYHVASTAQHVSFSQANHSLQPDHRYSAITTGDPTSSYFIDPALLPPGRTEEAASFDRANCDISYSTSPHTFQSGSGSGGTHKYVDGGPVPIAAAVPQAATPVRIDKTASSLHPNPLANSRPLIVTEPTFHMELTMYQNRPVVPVNISGLSVIQQRREVAVWLTVDISSIPTYNAKPWSAIRISRTPSVNTHKEDPTGSNILYVDVVVLGAAKHTEYTEACRNCKERRGAGPMIDFRGKADIIKVTNGIARVHFVFCCYPADRDEEEYYRVEVVLSERVADGQRRAIVRKQLPYYFDIYSRHMTEKSSDLE